MTAELLLATILSYTPFILVVFSCFMLSLPVQSNLDTTKSQTFTFRGESVKYRESHTSSSRKKRARRTRKEKVNGVKKS